MTKPQKTAWFQGIHVLLSCILLATTSIIIAGFMFIYYQTTQTEMTEDLHQRATFLTNNLAKNLVTPLWDLDRLTAEAILDAAMIEKQVYAIVVRNHRGELYSVKKRDELWHTVSGSQPLLNEGLIEIRKNIFKNDEKLGSITVFMTTKYMAQNLRNAILRMMIIFAALNALLMLILFFSIQKLIISPIRETAALLGRISKGDIPEMISKRYRGEFNEIRHSLNLLIDASNATILTAEKIAEGDLTIDIHERSRRDRLMQALNVMVRSLHRLTGETNEMINAVARGQLNVQGNPDDFKGGWRELITGINELIAGLQDALRRRMEEFERFTALLDQSRDVIFLLDVGLGRMAHVNRTMCHLLGYTKEELLSMSVDATMAPEIAATLLNESVGDEANDLVRNPIATFLRKRDGIPVPIEISIRFVSFAGQAYFVIVGRDITERKQAEAAILKEKVTAERYFDTAAVMLLVLTREGNVKKINRKGCEVLGCAASDAIGKDWFDTFIPDDRRNRLRSGFNAFMHGKTPDPEYFSILENENPVLTVSGDERVLLWNNSLLRDESGNISGVLSSGQDITEHRRAEAEKEKLAAQVRQLQKMESIGTLAGGIAHDFNNILAPIIGYSELLMTSVPRDDNVFHKAEKINSAANRAKSLVQQILTFSRQSEHPYQPLRLQPIINETLKLLTATLPRTIEIKPKIDEKCGPVMGDPTQVHQILMNFGTNAWHAMNDNGGGIEVVLEEIHLPYGKSSPFPDQVGNQFVRLTVSDTGSGMDKATAQRIFEPYFTTKQREGGTGLGLAVVHGIVKQMKGHITVYSEPGMGTTFHVYLPRVNMTVNSTHAVPSEKIPPGKGTILIVDDEEMIVDMMTEMLQGMGYTVTAHTSSPDALASFRRQPDRYDLIITDMSMPAMNGLALTQAILTEKSDARIIVCTGFSEMITENSIRDMGIGALVMKPVLRQELSNAIRKVMRNDGRIKTDPV